MAKIREEYFTLKAYKSSYLNENVIRSLLLYVNNFQNMTEMTLNMEKECQNTDILKKYTQRILSGEPYQYVIQNAEFCHLNFFVDKRVLIPRNETEELTMNVKNLIEEMGFKKPTIIDVCTGSGCIAISLEKMIKECEIFGSDISEDAIDVANINKERLNSSVIFKCGDLLKPFPSLKADVIVSNPPYIEGEETVDEQVLKHEPHLALFSSPSTLFYERIFKEALPLLNKRFVLAFEIGEDMEDQLQVLINKYYPSCLIKFEKDLYGKTRFLYIIKE